VRQMTDATGAITFARGYDPYGVVTYTTGASQTEFGFTGEQYDTYIKLIYLRSRMYDPASGRFTSRDTWMGDYNRPLSLNRWMYVEGNPVNLVDPTGNSKTSFIFGTYEDDYDENHKDAPRWTTREIYTVETALGRIAWAYAHAYNQEAERRASEECDPSAVFLSEKINPFNAFFGIHGGRVTFKWNSYSEGNHWGRAENARKIMIFKNTPQDLMTSDSGQRFITHEMGHAFENAYLEVHKTGHKPARNLIAANNQLNNRLGFADGFLIWQWSEDNSSGEIFADMFVGWAFNSWAPPPTAPSGTDLHGRQNENYLYGLSKSKFMMEFMPIWIYDTIEHRK
jgi:RHS repeat-associated protein